MPTILVVDDVATFRDSIAVILRAEGFDAVTADNAKTAIAALSTAKPHLILLDLGLPMIDGLEVLSHVRHSQSLKSLPVIILSAETDRNRITKAVQLGISAYMLKSAFSPKELVQRVRAALSAAQPGPACDPAAAHDAPQAHPVARAAAHGPSRPASPAAVGPPSAANPAVVQRKPAPSPVATSHLSFQVRFDDAPSDEAAAIHALKPIVTRTELLDRLTSAAELRGFSPSVSQVLRLASNDKSSLDDISKAVRQDQGMSLKILKLANSSVYSRGDRVDTVHTAILRIGLESIRQAVLNIGVVERFSSAAFSKHLSTPLFWEHSIACGVIAAELAHSLGHKDADSAFTAGLLHDLGRVILAEALDVRYVRVLEAARTIHAPLELVESRMLLLNHADIMDRMLNSWNFPKQLVEPIQFHHAPIQTVRGSTPARVNEILRLGLANRLTHALLLGDSGNQIIYPTEEHCRALDLSPDSVRRIEQTARQQADDAKFSLLTHSNASDWDSYASQLRATLKVAFRPLYISASPDLDAFRIFCSALAEPEPAGPPTLAVVHITAAKEKTELSHRLVQAEKAAGIEPLPVLLLSPGAGLQLEDDVLSGRRHGALSTPTAVPRLITAINALARADRARMAA